MAPGPGREPAAVSGIWHGSPAALRCLVFLGFSVTDTPQVAPILRSQSPSAGLDSFMLGAGVANTRDYPAGPLGGVLRCGGKTVSGIWVTICAWADGSVLGQALVLILHHVDHGWQAAGQGAFQGGHEISVLLHPLAVRAEQGTVAMTSSVSELWSA